MTAMSTSQTTKQTFREIADGIVVLWWKFFDWLAVVPWKTLVFVCILLMILVGGILGAPQVAFLFIIASLIIKAVAGGKHNAEVAASQAVERAEKEQLERTALEAHLEALQAQIEPHFLFNTLASIDQLILTDPPRASRMQQSLIRYLRAAMPQMRASGNGARPTLGQQVDLSRAFLEIMAVRMEDRLQAVMSVPEGLKSAAFPSMMLQTLVENAIRHGLEPKAEGGIDIIFIAAVTVRRSTESGHGTALVNMDFSRIIDLIRGFRMPSYALGDIYIMRVDITQSDCFGHRINKHA